MSFGDDCLAPRSRTGVEIGRADTIAKEVGEHQALWSRLLCSLTDRIGM